MGSKSTQLNKRIIAKAKTPNPEVTTVQSINAVGFMPTGTLLPYSLSTAPSGYIMASGLTIGSAASGATGRANFDTMNLYVAYWTEYSNTVLPIQDSAGVATTRGASAIADFNANKRLPVLDLRGRIPVGKDNMGGSAANRMTTGGSGVDGTTLGANGGAQTHQLTVAQMPSHAHGVNDPSHQHASPYTNPAAVGGNTLTGWQPNTGVLGSFATDFRFTGITIQATGGDGAHNNTQPSIVMNYIIKL